MLQIFRARETYGTGMDFISTLPAKFSLKLRVRKVQLFKKFDSNATVTSRSVADGYQ